MKSKTTFICVLLVFILGSVICFPPLNPSDDKELKPTNNNNKPITKPASSSDDYDQLSVPWKENHPNPEKKFAPQTGSLISVEAKEDDSVKGKPVPEEITNTTSITNTTVKPEIVDIPATFTKVAGTGKADLNQPFPVKYNGNGGDLSVSPYYKPTVDKVAPPPITDPAKKDVFGIQPQPIILMKPEDSHPMEILTPLSTDKLPCDPDRIINVTIPSAGLRDGFKVPFLPERYGCSSENDTSREKASPSVYWDNVSVDVVDFSLQVIQLGDECSGRGFGFGTILWHVEGIKGAASVSLQEGASHDKRLLFGGKELPNQWLEEYYSGPCPVQGATQCLRFKVLAHRANGRCQCGHADVLFSRAAKPQVWKYEMEVGSVGKK